MATQITCVRSLVNCFNAKKLCSLQYLCTGIHRSETVPCFDVNPVSFEAPLTLRETFSWKLRVYTWKFWAARWGSGTSKEISSFQISLDTLRAEAVHKVSDRRGAPTRDLSCIGQFTVFRLVPGSSEAEEAKRQWHLWQSWQSWTTHKTLAIMSSLNVSESLWYIANCFTHYRIIWYVCISVYIYKYSYPSSHNHGIGKLPWMKGS